MKKMMFVVLIFISLGLFADGTNWISYDGWVTGPGATGENNRVYLLPFGYYKEGNNFVVTYYDERPLLYETDMGWPVPDAYETELKYLFFGDTYFFMRDPFLPHNIMSKISDGNDTLDFNVESNAAEIERRHYFSPLGGQHLNTISNTIDIQNCIQEHGRCNQAKCEQNYSKKVIDDTFNYSGCFSYCNSCNHLENELDIFDYMDFNSDSKEERCKNFCKFDMVETYASSAYFSYDGRNIPADNNKKYNNGTSNIFLAARLNKEGSENGTQYKVKFQTNTGETGGTGEPEEHSAQLYSTKEDNIRRSKSIWKNSYEKGFEGFIGIYPRGYFYACPGAPKDSEDSCQQESKKLFVPYNVNGWDFLNQDIYCKNASSHHILSDNLIFLPVSERAKLKFDYLNSGIGIGIYNFEDECRIKFSNDQQLENPFLQPRTCGTTEIEDGCYQNYPNRHILWPNLSKMSNMTVIHGLDLDILSPNDNKEYIYFMGTGEAEVDVDELLSFDCGNSNNAANDDDDDDDNDSDNDGNNDDDVDHYEICNDDDDDENNDDDEDHELIHKTQKAYIARVRAYESEIKCAASYEYFAGITNGIARWEKDIDKAEPLYGFYPLQAMGAESIVKHRDLYWMTAPLNETTDSELGEDKKGVVVLASPDAFHWQKVDTILFENPERIWLNYAFFWLPPKLIETGDNTMPFLYSIWKSNSNGGKLTLSSFLNDNWHSKFTRYNLKSGKYKFMEKSKTRSFLLNTAIYDSLFINTIPGKLPLPIYLSPFSIFHNDTIAVPFTTFQNLYNLNFTEEMEGEREQLKKRYVIIEYCYCGDLDKKDCTDSETGPCKPFKNFVTENGVGEENWKIIDIKEDKFFNEYVSPCKNGNENVPDYMCNIPFEHGENLPKGIRKIPVWNWRDQIAKDYPDWDKDSANVILRFSHWNDIASEGDLTFEQGNYIEINKQLMENNKLVPYDCDGTGSSEIRATCQNSSSWRTTKMLHLHYRTPFHFPIIDPDKLRLEYLYPYPVMINDFGKPGDPVLNIWDMLTADHFAREFFKVSSFAYGNSVTMNLMSGAAATAVIKNGTMTIYAWGGSEPPFVPGRNLYGLETLLYIGTYNPETEVVTFEQTPLVEREGNNSPEFTAGTSMVYDDKNDKIYLIGALDKNGATRIYSLEDDNMRSGLKTWRSVTTIDLGRYFRLVKKSEHEYFAFGGETATNTFTRKAYLLDLNNMASPQTLQDIPTSGLANSFAAYSEMDQKLYVFGGLDANGASDRFLSYDIKTNGWSPINVSGGPGAGYGGVILVDYITETISLGGGVFVNNEDRNFKWIFDPKTMTWSKELKSGSYCLKESDSAIQGGIETSSQCAPFTHPFYNSFSAGTTVYSIAGKGNRLYTGTNDSIKIYDISDPNSPVLVSSFSTNNARVNDLEIEGDVLFAATSKGLYKLDASDPDELEQILFVSTGSTSQNEIELYDGKVYAGDDNGIKIRDKETLSVLLSANSGQVYDFAIENGEIAMFRSSFFNSGIQFRNAETLVETAYDYTSCNNVEVENFNGKLYLACDNYNYSFEANNGYIYFTQLSGDKRDLRENYTYNGYTYTPDGNYIRLSTNEEVPAICGNGIVEGDEVCDGTPIDCDELDSTYVSGIAACNSTCDGYVLDNCTAGNGGDGWN